LGDRLVRLGSGRRGGGGGEAPGRRVGGRQAARDGKWRGKEERIKNKRSELNFTYYTNAI
jgi:hypothetical protein